MKALLDAFWRAAAYCLHPKIIGLSILPLLIGIGLALGMGYFFWEAAVAGVRATLEEWRLIDAALKWIESFAGASFRSVLAPLVVVILAVPVIIVASVLLVAWLMTPSIVTLVAERRFAQLERKRGGGFFGSLLRTVGSTVAALLALIVSLPLWFIPPLVLLLPPLIWGWLTYRVMSYDVLANHASREERQLLLRRHGLQLLGVGIVSGYLGAAPSLLWAVAAAGAAGTLTLMAAPFVAAASVWLYMLVFAFSSLWFAHYALAALAELRREQSESDAAAARTRLAQVVDVPSAAMALAPPTAPGALPPPH